MADAIALSTGLTLQMNVGLDENLDPIYRNRSYRNFKTATTPAQMLAFANHINSLTSDTVEQRTRVINSQVVPD